jgi:hypothetical protein
VSPREDGGDPSEGVWVDQSYPDDCIPQTAASCPLAQGSAVSQRKRKTPCLCCSAGKDQGLAMGQNHSLGSERPGQQTQVVSQLSHPPAADQLVWPRTGDTSSPGGCCPGQATPEPGRLLRLADPGCELAVTLGGHCHYRNG